jgi:hypothetical protein
MSSTSFEPATLVAGQTKIYSKVCSDRTHKHFCDLYYIKIPVPIGDKFDLKEGDCLVWRYYPNIKTALMSKWDRKSEPLGSARENERRTHTSD